MINQILRTRTLRKEQKIYVSCDLRKAYDSVDIKKLFAILEKRVQSPEDRYVVELIRLLYKDRKILIGSEAFTPHKDVM